MRYKITMQSLTSLLQLIDHDHRAQIEALVSDMESWPDMILMVHQFDKQYTYASRQGKRVLGHQATTWNVDFLSAITHEDDIFSVNEKMYGYVIEASKPFYDKEGPHIMKILGRLRHASGHYVPIEFSGVVLRYDSAGAFQLGLGVYQDVSSRTVNETLKRKSEKFTRTIEDHLLRIKSLYTQMHPHTGNDAGEWPVLNNPGVSKIHIVGPEQLAIKVKHSIELQNILAEHAPGNLSLTNIADIGVDNLAFANQVVQCIERRLGDPEFTTERFARELNMSRGNLYKKVTRTFNMPPNDLIKRMRLDKAALLLRVTDKSITHIAFDVGFTDSSYFSKCFCAMHGITPLEYRKLK